MVESLIGEVSDGHRIVDTLDTTQRYVIVCQVRNRGYSSDRFSHVLLDCVEQQLDQGSSELTVIDQNLSEDANHQAK